MSKMSQLYEDRMRGIALDTEQDLENLLVTDEKKFYFALMYFYLTEKDLGDMVRFNVILCNVITLFCVSCNDSEITKYYSHFLDVEEIPLQCKKIYNELENSTAKNKT